MCVSVCVFGLVLWQVIEYQIHFYTYKQFYFRQLSLAKLHGGRHRGVMVKVMDCRIVVSKFKLQSLRYFHFRTNTLGKGMSPLIPQQSNNSTTTVLLEGWLWH